MAGQQDGRADRPGGRQGKKKKAPKAKVPFFPHSPTSVGSPRGDGFYPRRVRQRTPRKMCTLALPPPLLSLFDGSDAAAASASASRHVPSDMSLDGHSIVDGPSHAPTPVRHSSNTSVVSASVASVGGAGSGGSVHNPRLPPHLRAGMAPCDPLLVFDGRFALVATCDGRIAVYSIFDFDTRMSDDVKASERRRRAEWREEDANGTAKGEEKKDGQTSDHGDANEQLSESLEDEEEEESEWDMRARMHRREKAKQAVEPILIVPLPRNYSSLDDDQIKLNTNSSFDEEATVNAGSHMTPPTIVAMCATPGSGTSLIEQRKVVSASSGAFSEDSIAEDRAETFVRGSQLALPTLGMGLLGHVAVLTVIGEVHVLEFLLAPPPPDDLHACETTINAPLVKAVLSFRTGSLGATCICMHPVPSDSADSPQKKPGPETDSRYDAQRIHLSVGHRCGMIATFQVHSTCVYRKIHSFSKKTRQESSGADPPTTTNTGQKSRDHRTPPKSTPPHTRSKSDAHSITLSDVLSMSPGKAAPRVLFGDGAESGTTANAPRKNPLYRTLSEPIESPDVGSSELAPMVGPAKVVLCWRGKFEVPIRAMSSTEWPNPSGREDGSESSMLVVGLERRQRESTNQGEIHAIGTAHHSLSPAISLEVLNTILADKRWRLEEGPDPEKCISLYECCVWPAAGKEIKDGWMRGPRLNQSDPRDKLFQMLGVSRSSVTDSISCFGGPKPCFVSASSDGTVAISHHRPETGSWGVMEDDNQIKLYERCIGVGTLGYDERYIACCLRGGTVYVIPVADPDAEPSTTRRNEIATLSVPVDPNGDDDGTVRFVHNFTAGTAQTRKWKDGLGPERTWSSDEMQNASRKSIALVGWPGGNVDVFEVTPESEARTEALLSEAVEREVVLKLIECLLEVKRNNSLISSDLWCKAWDECQGNDVDAILSGIKDTSKPDFSAMRSLLLSLARYDSFK